MAFCAANEQKAITAPKRNCHRQGQLQNSNSSFTSKIPTPKRTFVAHTLTHLITGDGTTTIALPQTERLSAIYDGVTFKSSARTADCFPDMGDVMKAEFSRGQTKILISLFLLRQWFKLSTRTANCWVLRVFSPDTYCL